MFDVIRNKMQRSEALAATATRASEDWTTAYCGWAGVALPRAFVLGQSDCAVVSISRITAFPTGWDFQVVIVTTDPRAADTAMNQPDHPLPVGARDQVFRLGLEFGDHTVAVDRMSHYVRATDDAVLGAVMQLYGGAASSDTSWSAGTYWVSPLPPPGPLSFVCEWGSQGIPLTHHSFSASELLDAARAAIPIASPLNMIPRQGGGLRTPTGT